MFPAQPDWFQTICGVGAVEGESYMHTSVTHAGRCSQPGVAILKCSQPRAKPTSNTSKPGPDADGIFCRLWSFSQMGSRSRLHPSVQQSKRPKLKTRFRSTDSARTCARTATMPHEVHGILKQEIQPFVASEDQILGVHEPA